MKKQTIIEIKWYKMRKEDYNWNKMWISGTKWYMSEIIVINLLKKAKTEIK